MNRQEQVRSPWPLYLVVVGAVLGLSMPASVYSQAVEIEVNDTDTTDDDFLCWSPVRARARLAAPGAGSIDVRMRGTASSPQGGGLSFAHLGSARPTPDSFTPQADIQVTLPANGAWVGFLVAGAKPSTARDDVSLQAVDPTTGRVLGDKPVMVRMRKDAETLTDEEISRLVNAIAGLHHSNGSSDTVWMRHANAHLAGFNQIHGDAAFLTWHRAFLLSLERNLQKIDPSVAIPYWKYDAPAPRVFSESYLGRVGKEFPLGGDVQVSFEDGHPLKEFRDPNGLLVRAWDAAVNAPLDSSVLDGFLRIDNYSVYNVNIEDSYHNRAHSRILGWVGSGSSPRDPLFYLLHANVDRAYAHWQAKHDKFDGLSTGNPAYSPQGSYPGDGTRHEGHYLMDTLWPWNGKEGNNNTPSTNDDWPFSTLNPFPPGTAANIGPGDKPTNLDMIDYMDTRQIGTHLGFCYDDVNYHGR